MKHWERWGWRRSTWLFSFESFGHICFLIILKPPQECYCGSICQVGQIQVAHPRFVFCPWILGRCLPIKEVEWRGSRLLPCALHCCSRGSKPFSISAIQKAAHSGAPWRSRIIFRKSWLSSQLCSNSWLDCILISLLKSHWSEHKGRIFQKRQYNRKTLLIFPYSPHFHPHSLFFLLDSRQTDKKQVKQKLLQEKPTKEGRRKRCLCFSRCSKPIPSLNNAFAANSI